MTQRASEPTSLSQQLLAMASLYVPAVLFGLTASPARAEEAGKLFEVEATLDVAYCDGRDADPRCHRLDIFRPQGARDAPVLFFVHGGTWMFGDKDLYGYYRNFGLTFARHGIVTVMINYRLSPAVRHPEHVRDVARAFAWTHKNIVGHGGRTDQLFVSGHSAGGHLAALLATDATYLRAAGLDATAIKGVIPISGVYRIPEINVAFSLDDHAIKAGFSLGEVLPLPSIEIGMVLPRLNRNGGERMNLDLNLNPFSVVFGNDAKVRKEASPLHHVRPGLPPFLVLYAERDLPLLRQMAEDFTQALKQQMGEAELIRVEDRTHRSIVFHATRADDPVVRAMRDFIRKHTRQGE